MSAVASFAQEYLHTMSPTAARVAQDLESLPRQQPDSSLWFFRGPGGQKVVRDDSTGHSFKDEHSGPFSYRSNSQIDLIAEMEPPPPAIANLADNTHMNRDLVLSHCRVLSELKNALKTTDSHAKDSGRLQSRVSKYEPEFVAQEPPKPSSDDSGFISKLLGNKKYKSGYSEEKEQLVSSEKRCQIVASSDNYFKTNFGGINHNLKENHGPEESKALLAGNSLQESLAASTDSEFLSCDDTPMSVASPSSPSFELPKTGYDFLDNW